MRGRPKGSEKPAPKPKAMGPPKQLSEEEKAFRQQKQVHPRTTPEDLSVPAEYSRECIGSLVSRFIRTVYARGNEGFRTVRHCERGGYVWKDDPALGCISFPPATYACDWGVEKSLTLVSR